MSATEKSKFKDIKLTDLVKTGIYRWKLWQFKVTGKHGKVVECTGINVEAVSQYLYDEGIRHDNFKRYYKIVDNVIEEIKFAICNDMIIEAAKSLDRDIQIVLTDDTDVVSTRDQIISATHETVKNRMTNTFNPKHFDLDKATWLMDSKEFCYIPFENGVVKISGKKHVLISYSDIDGYVWKNSIIPHEFKFVKKKSVVEDILKDALGKQHWSHIQSALGYMIHNFIEAKGSKILFCIDEHSGDINNGGTGKDFINQILSKVRRVTTIPSRHLNMQNQFVWEKANRDTQILWLEDLGRHVNMEHLYNITNGINVRRQHTDPFVIKAKVGASLQHLIDMVGNSDVRRQIWLLFTDYFSKYRGGIGEVYGNDDILGETFKEWMPFYSMIVSAIQLYLKNGIVPMDATKLLQSYGDSKGDYTAIPLKEWVPTEYAIHLVKGKDTVIDDFTRRNFNQGLQAWAESSGYIIDKAAKRTTYSDGKPKKCLKVSRVTKGYTK